MQRVWEGLAVLGVALGTWWFVSDQLDQSDDKAEREVGCLVQAGEDCR